MKDTSRLDNNLENLLLLNSNSNNNEINNKGNFILNDYIDLKNNKTKNKPVLIKDKRAMTYSWDCKKFQLICFVEIDVLLYVNIVEWI